MSLPSFEQVVEDVRDGYVSRRAAEEVYGVIVDESGELVGVTPARQEWTGMEGA